MDKRLYKSKEWLKQKYEKEGLSSREMAEIAQVSQMTIRNYMGGFGIPRRKVGGHPKNCIYEDPKWLSEKYWEEGLSLQEVANLADCCAFTIYDWMRKHDIPRREVIYKRGKEHSYWKGGRRHGPNGYILRHRDSFASEEQNLLESMFYSQGNPKRRDVIVEHRAIMALALGRPLIKEERVHHINRNRSDNCLKNLRLITHHGETICPRCRWPMEFYDQPKGRGGRR